MTNRRWIGQVTDNTAMQVTTRAFAIGGGVLVAAGSAAGCASEEPQAQQVTYACVAEDGTVVPEDYCDDDGDGRSAGGGIFFIHTSNGYTPYRVGDRVAPGGSRVSRTDAAGRSSIGVAPKGTPKVGAGTITRGVAGSGSGTSSGSSSGG